MTPGTRGWVVLACLAIAAAGLLISKGRAAENHPHHGPEHFYATWMMPDARWVSCCNNEDCAPAQARMVDGKWQARFTDADEWTDVPDYKIERERDMPDGQAHLCMRNGQVFCFGVGSGS